MRSKFVILGLILVLAIAVSPTGFLRAGENEEQGQEAAVSSERILQLIQQLGSDSYEERERAMKELSEIGEPALKYLEEVIETSEDPEVRWRARRAKAAIELRKSREQLMERGRATQPLGEGGRAMIRISPLGKEYGVVTVVTPNEEYTLEVGEKGVSLKIKKKQDDGTIVEELYEADSIEQFREKYPEVAEKYGVHEDVLGGDGLILKFEGDLPIEDPMRLPKELLEKHDELLDRLFNEDWFKDFDEMFDIRRRWRLRDFFGEDFERQLDEWFARERERVPDFLKEFRERLKEESDEGVIRDEEVQETPAPKAQTVSLRELGVEAAPLVPALQYQLGLESGGALITSVSEGSRADEWGLKKFDIVVAVNGQNVQTVQDLESLLPEALSEGAAEDASIEIIRCGKKMTLERPE